MYFKKIANFLKYVVDNIKYINKTIYLLLFISIFIINKCDDILYMIKIKNKNLNNKVNINEIENNLYEIRVRYNADYCAINLFEDINNIHNTTFSRCFESHTNYVVPSKEIVTKYPYIAFEKYFNLLKINNYVYIKNTKECKDINCILLNNRNITTTLFVPLYVNSKCIGTLNLEYVNYKELTKQDINNFLDEKTFMENYFK